VTVALHRTLLADAVARITLRPYQQKLRGDVESAWAMGAKNVLAVLPTGGGKTALFSTIMADETAASCAVAHRQELVSQISLALARNRVRHRIIGPQSVVKLIVRLHMEEVGASYYDANAKCAVAGVDTLVRRGEQLAAWLPTVKLWVQDEAHHLIRDNKWGKAATMFPNARGLGVTATPSRADGMGLGRHADGVMDGMVVGPSMRELITMGSLTDYKLFAPKSDFDRSSLSKSISKTTGEVSAHESSKAVSTSSLVAHAEKGQVVGDVVRTYRKLLDGLLTIVFAPDMITGGQLEKEYNAAGIPAKLVRGDMGDDERIGSIRKFRKREYLVLINIALFDEGFDLPAIQAVQDVAATESFGRFVQRAGRMLRLMDGKDFGIYVDHVGNIARHATVVHYADQSRVEICHREWTLDRRERRSAGKSEINDTRTCNTCTGTFPRFLDACPYCGEPIPAPAQRSSVEWVDGDLYELDAATLATMRAAIARVDIDQNAYRAELLAKHTPMIGVAAHVKRLVATQEVVAQLREAEAVWAGYERAAGLSDREIMRKFFSVFGVDLWTAQTWKAAEMTALIERINGSIKR
jgi:superfamily II DNA or RNA helicase